MTTMRSSRSSLTVSKPLTSAAPAVLARHRPARQAVPGIVHDALRSAGEPLSLPVRAHMESRFGRDFSQVRVHTDERSAAAAQAVGARAFTAGRSIVFGAGQYQPEAGSGRTLLAHELTHVAQQSATSGTPAQLGATSDPAEREAQRAAQAVAQGGQVAVEPSASRPSVQRDAYPPIYQPHPYFQDLLDEINRDQAAKRLMNLNLLPSYRGQAMNQLPSLQGVEPLRRSSLLEAIYQSGVVKPVRSIVDFFDLSSGGFVDPSTAAGNFGPFKFFQNLTKKKQDPVAEPAPK